VPVYITDNGRVERATGWAPSRTPESILEDIHRWVCENEAALKAVF